MDRTLETPVVPIEALFFADEGPHIVRRGTAGAGELSGLATAYLTLERLIAERGVSAGSLDELLAAREETPVVPIESLAPDEEPIVAVETLLYRGERALRRIVELRPELTAAAAAAGDDGSRLTALLGEVLDLVELGLGAER
jgi:hypothetical protein